MTSFVGYSSKNKLKGPFTLRDVDLSVADFVNHLETRKGSRVMLPEFGSILPELVMEPFTADLVEQIKSEVLEIAQEDPRLSINNVQVEQVEQAVSIKINAMYVPTKEEKTIDLLYENFGITAES
tara:strand:+ start:911 stop:1285 length:375 start_codon:yes stop_codon:yes gene_type:complete